MGLVILYSPLIGSVFGRMQEVTFEFHTVPIPHLIRFHHIPDPQLHRFLTGADREIRIVYIQNFRGRLDGFRGL